MIKTCCEINSEPSVYFDCLFETCGVRINRISVSFQGAEPCELSMTIYNVDTVALKTLTDAETKLDFLNTVKKEIASALGEEAARNLEYADHARPSKVYFVDPTRTLDKAIKEKFIEQLNHYITF